MQSKPITWGDVLKYLEDNRFVVSVIIKMGLFDFSEERMLYARHVLILSMAKAIEEGKTFDSESHIVHYMITIIRRSMFSNRYVDETVPVGEDIMLDFGYDFSEFDENVTHNLLEDELGFGEEDEIYIFINHIERKLGFKYADIVRKYAGVQLKPARFRETKFTDYERNNLNGTLRREWRKFKRSQL